MPRIDVLNGSSGFSRIKPVNTGYSAGNDIYNGYHNSPYNMDGFSRVNMNGFSRVNIDGYNLNGYQLNGFQLNGMNNYQLNGGFTLNGMPLTPPQFLDYLEYLDECDECAEMPTMDGWLDGRAERKAKRQARKAGRKAKRALKKSKRVAKREEKHAMKMEKKARKLQRKDDRIAARGKRQEDKRAGKADRRAKRSEGFSKFMDTVKGVAEKALQQDIPENFEELGDYVADDYAGEKGLFSPPPFGSAKWWKKLSMGAKVGYGAGAALALDLLVNKGKFLKQITGKK